MKLEILWSRVNEMKEPDFAKSKGKGETWKYKKQTYDSRWGVGVSFGSTASHMTLKSF